ADRCLEQGIRFLQEARIDDVEVGRRGERHQVTYTAQQTQETLPSRWIVDASGRRAFLKRKLGLAMSSPHVGNAAWFRFKKHIKVDDWSEDPSWQAGHEGKTGRWYSTNHLMGEGYWVWLIPLASGSTSMGIVAAEPYHSLSDFSSLEKAIAWLEKHEPQCADAVKANVDEVQDFRAIKHYAVECKQVFSAGRWGITGEAGFFHDPFYSPGSDFIAFANTFLSDLICRDLSGKDFRIRAFSYDRIFKRFYYGTSLAYRDQYGILGDPAVGPVKILWDYLVYWSLTAFLFMQGRVCRQTVYLRNLPTISRLGKINHFMQDFFRAWHDQGPPAAATGVIDISRMPLIRQSNERLLEAMTDREFSRRFAQNADQMETLAWEIVDHAAIDVPVPFKRRQRPTALQGAFERVFHPSSRPTPEELSQQGEAAAELSSVG
ncbi:MAG: hypothetical protein AAF961_14855, partial [Planctomycetota bacterium]